MPAVEVREDFSRTQMGYAVITVTEVPPDLQTLQFSIRKRGGTARNLGPHGWQESAWWFKPEEAWYAGAAVKFLIEPILTEYLGPASFELLLQGQGLETPMTIPLWWPDELEPEGPVTEEEKVPIAGTKVQTPEVLDSPRVTGLSAHAPGQQHTSIIEDAIPLEPKSPTVRSRRQDTAFTEDTGPAGLGTPATKLEQRDAITTEDTVPVELGTPTIKPAQQNVSVPRSSKFLLLSGSLIIFIIAVIGIKYYLNDKVPLSPKADRAPAATPSPAPQSPASVPSSPKADRAPDLIPQSPEIPSFQAMNVFAATVVEQEIKIDVLKNTSRREQSIFHLVSVDQPNIGAAGIAESEKKVWYSPTKYAGSSKFKYIIGDDRGEKSTGEIEVKVYESPENMLTAATTALTNSQFNIAETLFDKALELKPFSYLALRVAELFEPKQELTALKFYRVAANMAQREPASREKAPLEEVRKRLRQMQTRMSQQGNTGMVQRIEEALDSIEKH